jgi:hypothetical protein
MNTFTCTCCRLDHPRAQLRASAPADHAPQTLCGLCQLHQGNYLARAENHEAQLRFRLDEAQRLAARMVELHQPRADGACSCGQRECATAVVLSDPWLNGRIGADARRDRSA